MQYALLFLLALFIAPLSCERKPPQAESTKGKQLLEVEFYPSKEYAKAVALLPAYKEALLEGDWKRATSVASNIHSVFRVAAEREQFLEKEIGKDRISLRVLRLCDSCSNGVCSSCNGSGICQACLGSGSCPDCRGLKRKESPCSHCVCPTCAGKGRCPQCWGTGQQKCERCLGTGRGRQVSREVICKACSGRGRVPASFAGSPDQRCMQCAGKGMVTKIEIGTCEYCNGRGYVLCSACMGSQKCPSCLGKGKIPNCPVCQGTGIVTQKCNACGGSGQCPRCKGKKVCANCRGTTKCPDCGGEQFVNLYFLPLARSWLVQPIPEDASYILINNADSERTAQTSIAVNGTNIPYRCLPREVCFVLRARASPPDLQSLLIYDRLTR